jgi:hypothetical protein
MQGARSTTERSSGSTSGKTSIAASPAVLTILAGPLAYPRPMTVVERLPGFIAPMPLTSTYATSG